MGKEDLIICFQDTVEKSSNGSLRQRTARAIKSNRVYKEGFVSKSKHRNESASIEVYSGTTFEIAKRYRSHGKIAVLNFANPEYPGGGVQRGAMAQEECLCRSSNLFSCISAHNVFDEYYVYHRSIRSHFYTDRLIYTKDVTVFKDDSVVPQALPENDWFDVDVITCAAPYLAKRKHTNGATLFELFKSRVKNIFEAARDNNVDYLILGAFGCGAFKNPPLIVAEAFRRTIEEQNYLKDFKQIIFAIKPTGEYCPNLSTFLCKFDDYAPDAGERTALLDEPLEWRLHRYPALPTESRFSDNRKFSSWQLENKYFGKQFSVFGDSISTLDGFNPKGYKVFYAADNCVKSGVAEAKDTWWDKVIGFFGGELLVNNSWSGSRVTKLKDKDQLFPSGCSDERTAALHINDVKPDVILVYLGTNDWANGIPTLEYWKNSGDYENWLGTMLLPNEECFDVAYEQMLTKLRANYPNAEIWCCTLCETYISKRPDFKFPHKYAGTHIEEYNEIIRDIVRRNGCRLIDLYDYKMAYDSIDGSHPTNTGMNTIATMVIREMVGQEADLFLDCENAKHDYVVSEQYTGGTKYVCAKCAKVMHTTTLLPPQEVTMDTKMTIRKDYDPSRYVWGDKKVNRIKNVSLSWGNLPIYHIDIENDIVSLYRRINGSRDGWMSFPEGYFDEKNKPFDVEEKRKLFQFLETIDFTKWNTNETTIYNIENMACGFCVTESFSCVFDDDTTFYCATPPQSQFKELVEYFKNFFPGENMEPFYPDVKPRDEKTSVLGGNSVTENSEYIMLDPNITTVLYSDILRLTIESSGKTVQFQKDIVEVGRDKICDLLLEGKSTVARRQATFFYEKDMWFLRDNFSTNGTWLNGAKIQPGKKYQLATNDEINFAMAERVVFDKHKRNAQPMGDPDAKVLAFLEAGMATFAKSDHKDEVSLKLIIAALSDAPLYFPVEIDLEAMLGSVDPTKLKPGDTLQPNKDVKMRILTLTPESGVEFVPMFTSNDEVNKGPSASIIRFYPQDYLPKLIQMDKPVIINPFSENRFLLSKQLITEVLLPLVQNKTKPQDDVVEQPADKYIGKTVDGKYEVLKLIGRGGFYTTYLVRNIHVNKVWAMKVCDKKNRHYSPVMRENILTEPYMMQKLNHPAIPKVVDIIEDEDSIFIVRDYIEGETLETIARMYGAQPAGKVIEWGKQMCSALGYLHSQNPPLIYRDMKPANVILKPDGTINFIDFGIMRAYKPNQSSDTCCLGTKGYAAPEQFGGSQTDARTDIFGLGMTMFRLVTGINPTEPPYEIKPICLVNPNLPKGLEYIISKCTQPNPAERYQSCDELMADLNNYLSLPKPKGIFGKLFGKK